MDKAGFTRPEEISFDTFGVAGIQILIASDIEFPQRLSITRAHLPPLKLHVEWDGKPWGKRGGVDGAGGGGG